MGQESSSPHSFEMEETHPAGLNHEAIEVVVITRIQLILSEKRTTLAVLRTGIAVLTLPISVITVLVATSRYYNFMGNMPLLFPLFVICIGLFFLGFYLIHRSILRIWKQEHLIEKLKHSDPELNRLYQEAME